MTSSLRQRFERAVEYTIETIVSVGDFILLTIQSSPIILIFIAIGITLLAFRWFILFCGPWLVKHGAFTRDVINAAIALIDAAWLAIEGVVDAIIAVAKLFGAHWDYLKYYIHFVNIDEAIDFVNYAMHTCRPYNNPWIILSTVIQLTVGVPLCPVLRVSYPLPGAGVVMNGALGWASPDAEPAPGNNCHEGTPGAWQCAILGIGILILGFLIPLLLIFLLLEAVGKDLRKAVFDAVAFVVGIPMLIVETMLKIADKL